MNDFLKYAAWIVGFITIAYICATLRDCGPVGDSSDRVVIPSDNGYLPIIVQDYKPKSTPFEKPVKPVSKLPKGIKETDVKRVITVRGKAALQIIEMKNDDVHVPRQSDSLEVIVTDYRDPVFQFGLFVGAGVDLNAAASPAFAVSFVKISGNILAPVIAADIQSIGVGIGYRFYHDLTITPLLMWNYSDTQRTIKLNVSYQL